jgi:TRAP-type uncharacterized transport system substrate-binding protein
MDQEPQPRRRAWHWLAPALGIVALALAAYVFFHNPRGRTYRLTMTGGSAASTRYQVAETLRRELALCGLDLETHLSHGSEEEIDLVNSGEIDCAFVQGGLGVGDRPNVRLVAMMQIEPLHLLVKKELAEKVTERLTALDGKTVNVDEPATGTHTLAVAVLAFAGLTAHVESKPGGYYAKEFDLQTLMTANGSELPDAIFLCASLPSRVTTHLVTQHGYQLVPLPFGEAFALSSMGQQLAEQHGSHTIDKGRTYPVTIPAFTYGVEPPTPPKALPTLGTRMLLVANKGVDKRPIERMIDCIYSSKFAQVVRPPLDVKMMEMAPELPWHDGAEAYRQRNRPVVSGMIVDSTQKGFAIFAAAAKHGSPLKHLPGLVSRSEWICSRACSQLSRRPAPPVWRRLTVWLGRRNASRVCSGCPTNAFDLTGFVIVKSPAAQTGLSGHRLLLLPEIEQSQLSIDPGRLGDGHVAVQYRPSIQFLARPCPRPCHHVPFHLQLHSYQHLQPWPTVVRCRPQRGGRACYVPDGPGHIEQNPVVEAAG